MYTRAQVRRKRISFLHVRYQPCIPPRVGNAELNRYRGLYDYMDYTRSDKKPLLERDEIIRLTRTSIRQKVQFASDNDQ